MKSAASTGMNRRTFVRGSAAIAAAVAAFRPFEALARRGRRVQDAAGYGPLVPVLDETTGLPLLRLPEGFTYLSFGWTGDPMVDGGPTPGAHDGAACFAGACGRVYYVRNHELSQSTSGSFARPELTYDRGGAAGGTTTVVFDEERGRYLRTVPTLSGTIRNCAGGSTPWGTWLTCEENLAEPGTGGGPLEQTHGWIFEVPPVKRARPRPLRAMGRFNHEAVAVDPHTGFVYESEDTGTSGLYRFEPNHWGRLRQGGKLQMLRVKGAAQLHTGSGIPVGESLDIDWVPIDDPERRDDAPGDGLGCFRQGQVQGGASFVRGEGMWYGNGRIYFISTSGGAAGEGQVWELDPRHDRLKLIFESPGEDVLDNPDNITVSPRGGLLLCEDGDRVGQRLQGLTCDGTIFDFAQNDVVLDGEVNGITGDFRGREWAGAAFSPNGCWLLASIQTPGITFAITGPWERGAL